MRVRGGLRCGRKVLPLAVAKFRDLSYTLKEIHVSIRQGITCTGDGSSEMV